MKPLTLTIAVENGRLAPTDGQKAQIAKLLGPRSGKAVTVKFSAPMSSRSLEQNRFYWGVILTEIAAHTGHTTEEVHAVVKDLFLTRKFITLGSLTTEIRKTTTDLTVGEFANYLEQIAAWAAQELGLNLPEPTRVRP